MNYLKATNANNTILSYIVTNILNINKMDLNQAVMRDILFTFWCIFLQAICLWEIICGDTFHEKREIYYSKMTTFWAAIFYQQCKAHILQKTRFQTDSHHKYTWHFLLHCKTFISISLMEVRHGTYTILRLLSTHSGGK